MINVSHVLPDHSEQSVEEVDNPQSRQHLISNQNRWSRAVFEFKDVASDRWHELSFQLNWDVQEKSRLVQDFASIGISFLADDGSAIDFAYVPGLTRTLIDPHSYYIPGPDYLERSSTSINSAKIRCAFFIPSPARRFTLSVRSWRNSHPFAIDEPELKPIALPKGTHGEAASSSPLALARVARRSWEKLGSTPLWMRYGVVPGQRLVVRGQLINEASDTDGALARIVFRDASGAAVPPPYEDVQLSPDLGAFIEIPTHRKARRFTLELIPPGRARSVEIGFQTRGDNPSVYLITPLELSLEDLLLEGLIDEGTADPAKFLEAVWRRLESPGGAGAEAFSSPDETLVGRQALQEPITFDDRLRTVQHGVLVQFSEGNLTLLNMPAWELPEAPVWTEDPFQSPAWRLEYQSLAWLCDIASDKAKKSLSRALELAVSWMQANPWGSPQDPLSAYPSCLARRAEALIRLVSVSRGVKGSVNARQQRTLVSELIRHGFALAEIVGQNIFSHSILQIQTACSLLAVSRGVPGFPLSFFWETIAVAQLKSAFDQLLGPDGAMMEQSLHAQLEIASLGLILLHHLGDGPEEREFRESLTSRLKKSLRRIVAVTDPSGLLPAFGEHPEGYHHASWLRRLLSAYGRPLLSDSALAEELSYPKGIRFIIDRGAGTVILRKYDQTAAWSFLAATFRGQHHENGHHDCSSFVYTAGGVRWIVDSGGSTLHEAAPARQYLLSSRAHNIAIPDGRTQLAGEGWIEAIHQLEQARAFRIGTNAHGTDFAHARTYICLDDLSAIGVFDRFRAAEGSAGFEGLLHLGDRVAVALVNSSLALGLHGRSKLRIVPHAIDGTFSGMEACIGRCDMPGFLQGYASSRAGGLQPTNVLSYRFSGTGSVCGGVILAHNELGLRKILEHLKVQEVQDLLQ